MTLRFFTLSLVAAACLLTVTNVHGAKPLPTAAQAVLDKPLYKNAVWGVHVVDLDSGEVLYSQRSDEQLLVGSVRKLFSVGLALDKLGVNHRFVTPIYRQGELSGGVLDGNLILVAAGDLSMGGRANPDGSLAITNYDHNEANSLGNAQLTKPDPLAGYKQLARQVAAAGIREIRGDVIIDDRLFVPFNFRDEFDVRPIFVNDDVVDVMIRPAKPGQPAVVDHRPVSSALAIKSKLASTGPGTELAIESSPELLQCIGKPNCWVTFAGNVPTDFKPMFTGAWPLVRTVRIVQPQNYARTVLIEALKEAGVTISAPAVAENPVAKLPARDSYAASHQVAKLTSAPYADFANWILQVSYNIGADTSLVLFGLTQGADSMTAALEAERATLAKEFNIAADQFHFIDGSGGGETSITPSAVVSYLKTTATKEYAPQFTAALPSLAVSGSLAMVDKFLATPDLAAAKGQVQAKTGTYLTGDAQGRLTLRAQAFAGYITTKSGRRLAYALVVNNVEDIKSLDTVIEVFQDEGTVSAIIWNEN